MCIFQQHHQFCNRCFQCHNICLYKTEIFDFLIHLINLQGHSPIYNLSRHDNEFAHFLPLSIFMVIYHILSGIPQPETLYNNAS